MFRIDRAAAERTFTGLTLSENTRRFADWWLSQIGIDGRPLPIGSIGQLSSDLAESSLVCEVRPWATVICRSSGDNIDRALGMTLGGRNMLGLMAPNYRATRLSRFVKVAAGGLQLSYRRIVAADGTERLMQELMMPHPDLSVAPLELGAAMTIGFFDINAQEAGAGVLVSQGALGLVNEPLFVDLRPVESQFTETEFLRTGSQVPL